MIGLTLAAVAAAGSPAVTTCDIGPPDGRVRLNVVATAVRSQSGEMAFTVYPDDARRFLAKGGKLLRIHVPAQAPRTSICLLVPPGHYALATYHDENGDHHFNHTLFSVKEGFGFSNDAPASFGLPKFANARFSVGNEDVAIRIRTRYPR